MQISRVGPGLARQHNRGVTPERSLAAANSDGGDGARGVILPAVFSPGRPGRGKGIVDSKPRVVED